MKKEKTSETKMEGAPLLSGVNSHNTIKNYIYAPRKIHVLLLFLLGVIFLLSIVNVTYPHILWKHFKLTDYPLHSTLEALGAIVAILMAFMPLQVLFGKFRPSYVFVSVGFLVMGLWDLFHSFYLIGHGFVFTHTIALLSGGFFFALIVLPWNFNPISTKKAIMWSAVCLTLILAALTATNRSLFPEMIHDGHFTTTAKYLNLAAGLLFLVSASKLFAIYLRDKNIGVLILVFVAVSSAIVGITFQYSMAWKDDWWLWHIIRFVAFLAILGYMFWRIRIVNNERNKALKDLEYQHIQLAESEKRFSLVNEATGHGLWDWNVVTNEVYFSPVWKKQIGYEEDELENTFENWVGHLHPDDRERSLKQVEEYINNPGKKFIIEFRFKHKDGHYVWIHNEAASEKDDEGKVIRMFGAHTDITKQKVAEEKLKDSEKQFRIVFENSPIGKSRTGLDGSLNTNLAFSKATGYSLDELRQKNWKDITHPDDIGKHEEINDYLLAGKHDQANFEKRYLHKKGYYIWVEVSTTLHRNKDGEPQYFISTINDITNRKESEEQIRQSEKKFKGLFENDPSAIFIADPQTGLLHDVNPAAEKLMEMSREELIGLHQSKLHPEDVMEEQIKQFKELQNQPDVSVDTVVLTKSGTRKPVEIKVSMFEIDGKPQILGIFHDVSRLVEGQKKLKESEKKYRTLTESSQDQIFTISKDLSVLYVNTRAAKSFRSSPEEIVGKQLKDIFPPEIAQQQSESISKVIETGKSISSVTESVFPDKTMWLDTTLVPLKNESGETEAVMGVSRDVSAQKIAEEALKQSEEKHRAIFKSATDAFIIVNMEGKIVEVNPSACNTYGYEYDEMIGREVPSIIHPDYHYKFTEFMHDILEKGSYYGETIDLRKNGSTFQSEVHGTIIQLNGEPHMLGIIRDVSEKKQREDELKLKDIVFRSSVAANSTADLAGNLTSVNQSFLNLWGYASEEEVLGEPIPKFIKYEKEAGEILEGLNAEGKWQGNYTALKKNGSTFIAQASASVLYNADGEKIGYQSSVINVTEAFEAEKRLKDSEAKFRNLFNSVSIPLCQVKDDGRIESINKRFVERLGYTLEDIPTIDHWWVNAYPDENYRKWVIKNWENAVGKSIKNKTDIESDTYNVACKNGEIRQFIIAGITLDDGLLATFIDVTEKRKAEQQIIKSESMLKTAQQIAKVGNWELDIVNNKLYWSDEIFRIFGLQPQKFEATYEAFLEHIHPDDRGAVNEAYTNSLETKAPYEITHRVLLKDKTIKYVKEKCDTDFDKKGKPLRSVGIVQDITAEKLYEDKINQEKEFTESVINTLPGIFYLFDQNGKFLKWNNTLAELSGLSFEEVGMKSPLDFIAPSHREKVGEAIQTAFTQGNVLVEADFLVREKSPVPFLFTAKRIIRDNEPLLVGVGIDLTKRLQAEQEKEKALHDLNERVKEMTCLIEVNEAIKDPGVNIPQVMEKITASIPKGWQHPENTAVEIALDDEIHRSEPFKDSKLYLQERILVQDIARGYIKVTVFGLNSKKLKSLFLKEERELLKTIATNISIYIQRVESEKEIRESEENFRSVLSNSPVSIWQEDWTEIIKMVEQVKRDGIKDYKKFFNENRSFVIEALTKVVIDDVNLATLEMFEAENRNDLLKSLEVVFATEDTLPGFIGELVALAEGKQVYETEMKLNTAKGNLIHTILRMSFPSEEAHEGRVLVSIMDISELKKIQHQLNDSMEKLKRSNKELEQFAYVASHDLQEPLRMVSSYTQLLERRYKDQLDERASKYIYYAVDGANRMQNLINDLLDFSRISTRGEKFTKTDTEEAVQNAINSLSMKIKETGAKINIGKLPEINGDGGQIERLFLNLISNAIKFSKPEGNPEVSISASEQKNKWLFRVQDNGIGIDEKYKEKVFVIFQRLHGANTYKGTGIGLAICKRIVQRHQGEIWFESEENKGTTFYFTLKKSNLKNS